MHNEQRGLQRHFARRPCPACQQCQIPEVLLVLARRQLTRMVMVTCGACHHRGIYVVSLPPPHRAAVNDGDVSAMHRFLATFDGDFRHLFGPDMGPQLAAD